MDEKTEELRDLFVDVAGEETVTESQTETRGSLVDTDDEEIDARLVELVGELRDHHDFETGLETATYVQIARGFYDGDDDAAIADGLGADREQVVVARYDLHLLRDDDTDAPFDLGVFEARPDADDASVAADLDADVDAATVARYRRAFEAREAARDAGNRFQLAFDDVFADANLDSRFTDGMKDDGLKEAAEDIETNVSF